MTSAKEGFDPEMQDQTLVVRAEVIGPRYFYPAGIVPSHSVQNTFAFNERGGVL